jgi:hypothetical protein
MMKQLVKRMIRPLWRGSAVIRRPVAARFDARIQRLVIQAIDASRGAEPGRSGFGDSADASVRIEYSLGALHEKIDRYSVEVDLVLNTLVREIARLQYRLDEVESQSSREGLSRSVGLTLVDGEAVESSPAPVSRVG